MRAVPIQIVRFVDPSFPGFVECQLIDAFGKCHTFVDKVPIFTSAVLWDDSSYPQPGIIGCVVLDQLQDAAGRDLAKIDTSRPWTIESTDGATQFMVVASQLIDI